MIYSCAFVIVIWLGHAPPPLHCYSYNVVIVDYRRATWLCLCLHVSYSSWRHSEAIRCTRIYNLPEEWEYFNFLASYLMRNIRLWCSIDPAFIELQWSRMASYLTQEAFWQVIMEPKVSAVSFLRAARFCPTCRMFLSSCLITVMLKRALAGIQMMSVSEDAG